MNTKIHLIIIAIIFLIISTLGCALTDIEDNATETARIQDAMTKTAAAAAKPSNTPTPTHTPSPTLTATPTLTLTPTLAPKEATGVMKQRIVLGDVAFTVLATKVYSGTAFVAVKIENLGKEPLPYNFSNFTLIDPSNNTIVADPKMSDAGTIAPGKTASSPNILFKSSQLGTLIYSLPFGSIKVPLRQSP